MKFIKEELAFLELYSASADTTEELNDKVQITFDKEKDRIIFTQTSKDVSFLTLLENRGVDEDFNAVYPISQLSQMVKISSKESVIEIGSSGIKFGSNSNYKFESYNYEIQEEQALMSMIYDKQPVGKFKVVDIHKLKEIKSFMGSEGLDIIALLENHFVVSNDTITGIVQTKNKLNSPFYFSKGGVNLLNHIKAEEVEISVYDEEDRWSFKVGDTYIFIILTTDWSLPNIFDKDIMSDYYHETKVIMSKPIFNLAVERMKVIAQESPNYKMYLKVQENSMELKSVSTLYGEEIVEAEVDASIIGTNVIVSAYFLSMILDQLKGDKVIIRIDKEDDCVAISFEDETTTKIFAHSLYEDVEFTSEDDEDEIDDDDEDDVIDN